MSETLYVLEAGAWLKKDGGSLVVIKGKTEIDRIPGHGLKRLILMGRVSMTSGVVDFLLENQVETVFASPSGRFRARLGVDAGRHVDLRRNQYARLSDTAFAARTARTIVAGKIANMATLVTRRARDYASDDLAASALRLMASVPREDGLSMDAIRGHEGLAGRIYFSAFTHLIRNEAFSFTGRNRRPPKDPVNAMLSYVYTVLTMDVLSAIQTVGLDPYLGSLHEIVWGRPSLACDLVEEFRAPVADRLILGLINRRVIDPNDFIRRDTAQTTYTDDEDMALNRPVSMKPQARTRLMAAYEEMMNATLPDGPEKTATRTRTLILNQARRFAEALNGGAPYQPFAWR
jgi:CRISPR-associated protein Cas1